MHELLHSNLNFFWGGVLAETLRSCGLRHAVISPGSRSAPLTTAFALTEGIEAKPILDERSAAFYALGLAKATQEPVALICTSGTAAANYFPAIIEAHYSHVPLIVLSADRPPELRDCAAGQAIDQQKLYGDYVTWFHELSLPEENLFAYLRNRVREAWQKSCLGQLPVHLNVPFREPLAPVDDGKAWSLPDGFFAQPTGITSVQSIGDGLVGSLRQAGEGLIIAGPYSGKDREGYVMGVTELARCLGWPLLADVLSPMRHANHSGVVTVASYDAILRDEAEREKLRPQAVLQLGPLPTSKVLRAWLGELDVPTWIASSYNENLDPLNRNATAIQIQLEGATRLGVLADEFTPLAVAWAQAEQLLASRFDKCFSSEDSLFEGKLSWLLGKHLPASTPVFVASSMPVRDAEFFWPLSDQGYRVSGNRGANGIDGTLSSALGFAEGCGQPGVLLTGDLAFLHDANGLLASDEYKGSLTVFLINNYGGGIFEKLPISKFDPPFEKFFATPQRVDIGELVAAHGIEFQSLSDWNAIIECISELPEQGIRVIELKTDRKADMALRGKLLNG